MTNKIIDYITNKEIVCTLEEKCAIQPFSKILVEDYGYPKELIQTHPQYCVKTCPSNINHSYPIDIAVFKKTPKNNENIYIVVECKNKSRKDGLNQLEDYLRFCKAEFGVLYNGEDKVFLKKYETNGKIEFKEIINIPNYGQKIEDIGKYRKKDLQATHNLKQIFKIIRNYLAGNAIGITTDDILAQQLINIIFCKIYDERFTKLNEILKFRAEFNENPKIIKERICEIFENVKNKYREVFCENDQIIVDPISISYIVGMLQKYSLMNTDRDVVSDAFEIFIGHAIKGDKGQFFTPRNIIKMIIDILSPNDNDLIIDPACGSGGFLIETLRYVWHRIECNGENFNWGNDLIQEEKILYATTKIRGIEKDFFLTKIAKAYMSILGNFNCHIYCEDSLNNPNVWGDNTQVNIPFNMFDIVVTNPPFGKSINVVGENKLKQYEFGYKWKDDIQTSKLKNQENPQILFIERALQLLKTGGKLAIILPETYLHAPSVKYVIKHIAEHNNIFAVVDLPHNTFRPNCNAKCVVLFIQKNIKQQDNIIMCIVKEMGHNHQGKPIYRFNETTKTFTNKIWDDCKIVSEEFKHPDNVNNKLVFCVNKNNIINHIYVPRYYWQKNINEIHKEALKGDYTLMSLQQLISEKIIVVYNGHGSPPSEFKGTGDIFYVRAGDIIDWDIYKNPTSSVPYEIYKKCVQGKIKLREKDILFVKEGSYRIGDVALLSAFDTEIFLNHHTLIIRVENEDNKYGIDAFYLLYLLSHRIVKKQLFNKIMIDTTLPNIGDRWKELMLPISNDYNKIKKIKNVLIKLFKDKWENQKEFYEIKKKIF